MDALTYYMMQRAISHSVLFSLNYGTRLLYDLNINVSLGPV